MNFQNPKLLYALLAIAIPIIIHLFNLQRNKKIYFSSIRFLKEIKQKKQQRTKLKNLLILLSRILAISFLTIAFAKPFIPIKKENIKKNIIVYIDNSLSMDIDFGNGNLLEIAKNNAKEIIKSYPDQHKFYVVSNNFSLQNNVEYSKKDIFLQIDKINPTYKQKRFEDIINRINLITNETYHLYFISDLQEKTLKFNNETKLELTNQVTFIHLKNLNLPNVCIDSVMLEEPIFKYNDKITLLVKVSNSSNEKIINEPLYLHLNDKQKSQQYINLSPFEKKDIFFNFIEKKSIISGDIRTQDNPISFDNKLFFTINKLNKVNVSVINTKNKKNCFRDLFKNDTSMFLFNEFELENINYSLLLKQDFIVLNETEEISSGLLSTLNTFLNKGGSLLIVPPPKLQDFKKFNALLSELKINNIKSNSTNDLKINDFILENDIYKNVFTNNDLSKIEFPISNKHYKINKKTRFYEIIKLANKDPFLVNYDKKNGRIYQFTSPLSKEYNNFKEHALFVPTLINIATSSCKLTPQYYTLGETRYIISKERSNDIQSIRISGNNFDIVPTIINQNGKKLIDHNEQITESGVYSISFNNKIKEKIAFNINSSENKIKTIDNKKLTNIKSRNNLNFINSDIELSNQIKNNESKEYWKIALMLSLLFFGIEILLIKKIKI